MRYVDSIFGSLLKPIDRRWFQSVVERHDADAYDKSFKSWDHLVTLVFAQWSRVDGLRGLETTFNANAQAHYHLARSIREGPFIFERWCRERLGVRRRPGFSPSADRTCCNAFEE